MRAAASSVRAEGNGESGAAEHVAGADGMRAGGVGGESSRATADTAERVELAPTAAKNGAGVAGEDGGAWASSEGGRRKK